MTFVGEVLGTLAVPLVMSAVWLWIASTVKLNSTISYGVATAIMVLLPMWAIGFHTSVATAQVVGGSLMLFQMVRAKRKLASG